MTIKIYESNRIEALVEPLVGDLRNKKYNSPLSPQHFLIGNFGVEQWLISQLTNSLGVLMNAQFLFTQNWLVAMAEKLKVPSDSFFQKNALTFRIFNILKQWQKSNDNLPSNLFQWFSTTGKLNNLEEIELYKLAQDMAAVYDSYQWQRVNWLKKWQNNQNIELKNHDKHLSAFQKYLWQKLYAEYSPQKHSTRFEMIEGIINKIKSKNETNELKKWLENGLYVFAVTPIMPPIWNCLQTLSSLVEVKVYQFNPSQELWFEQLYLPQIESKLLLKQGLEWESSELFYQHHPLLMNWGQIGANDLQQILNTEKVESFRVFVEPKKTQGHLQHIQKLILEDINHNQPNTDNSKYNDHSLQIYSCENKYTELQCLLRSIKKWLQDSKSSEKRTLSDILILSPNIEDYQDWIPIVFSEIPYHFNNHSNHKDSLLSAFEHLIQIFESECNLNQLVELFSFKAVKQKLNMDVEDLSLFLNELNLSGFRWGLSDKQRDFFGHSGDHSLQNIIQKMSLDFLQNNKLELSVQDFTNFYEFINYLQDLINCYHQTLKNHSISDWLGQLADWLDLFFAGYYDDIHYTEYRRLHKKFEEIQEQMTLTDFNEVISYKTLLNFVAEKWQSPSVKTIINPYQLNFCDFRTARQIPHLFVAVIGCNNESLKPDANSNLDLSNLNAKISDRSVEAEHNYMFLESLLAAREVYYLSYANNVNDNEVEEAKPFRVFCDYVNSLNISDEPFLQTFNWQSNDNQLLLLKNSNNVTTPENLPIDEISTTDQWAKNLTDPLTTYLEEHSYYSKKIPQEIPEFEEEKLDYFLQANFIKQIITAQLTTNRSVVSQYTEYYKNQAKWLSSTNTEQQLSDIVSQYSSELESLIDKYQMGEIEPTNQSIIYQNKLFALSASITLQSNESNITVTGSQLKTHYLFKCWLDHLLINTKQTKTSYYFYLQKNTYSKQLKCQLFDPINPDIAKQYIEEYHSLLLKIRQQSFWTTPNYLLALAFKDKIDEESIKKIQNDLERNNYYRLNDDEFFNNREKMNKDSLLFAQLLWKDCFTNNRPLQKV